MDRGAIPYQSTKPPLLPSPGPYESPTLPLPPPRSEADLHDLVLTIGSAPSGEREWVREAIAGLREDSILLELIEKSLADRPVHELGFTMTLMSITGELRNTRSLEVLSNLMWAATSDLLGPSEHANDGCVFDPGGMIQARAVEMFAWIAAGSRDDEILRVVAEHPDRAARLAAADSFLYNLDDGEEALRRVMNYARPEDQAQIGVPRFVRTASAGEFDRRLLANLDELPLPDATRGRKGDASV